MVIGFAKNEKPKTKNEKKGSPILSMELPLPSGVAALTKKRNLQKTARQVFWLSDQPEEVSLPTRGLDQPPAVAGNFLTVSVPDYSGGTAPDLHRVPDCLGG